MRETCIECGEPTVWEQELGSAICTHCGTLSNPSQSVLASHLDHVDTSGYDYSQYWSSSLQGGSAIKGRNGWNLPGQDKEAGYRRNTVQMHEFIRSVTSKLGHPGLAPRAQHIFDLAMREGRYRWGRKAKLTAGAGVAIALREAHKADSIWDIAYLLEEPPVSIGRSFTSVTQLLNFSLSSADPSVHLPTLQKHFLCLLNPTSATLPLPSDLLKSLQNLAPDLSSVIRTATSLSSLTVRIDSLNNLPTPATACALLILALEAELGGSLPNAGALAQALGGRMGVSKRVVMERYKMVYDEVEMWIREVPWLERHQRKCNGKGRSKVAKRVVVARGLKDVVQFQDELWKKRMDGVVRPVLSLEFEDDDDDAEVRVGGGIVTGVGGTSDTLPLYKSTSTSASGARLPQTQAKRPTPYQRTLTTTSQFVLNPLSLSGSPTPIGLLGASSCGSPAPNTRNATVDSDLLHHLLTIDDCALEHAFSPHGTAPTRLQKLIAVRREADVGDEELFDEGELEGFLRSEEEMQALQAAFGWESMTAETTEFKSTEKWKKKRKRVDDAEEKNHKSAVKRTKRINMDALARVLDPDSVAGLAAQSDDGDEDHSVGGEASCYLDPTDVGQELPIDESGPGGFTSSESPDGEEVVGEWRPMSPGGGGFDDDRYDM